MTASKTILRRYTDLASALDMLQRRSITLLRPSTWDDKNDQLMMRTYQRKKKLATLLALCLTSKGETYHHWKVFTDRSNGVCISFYRKEFSDAMKAAGAKVRTMDYLTLDELAREDFRIDELPFLKRLAFKDEGEVRVIYQNAEPEPELKKVEFDLSIISRITLSPWMPPPVADSVKRTIKLLTKGADIELSHSQLVNTSGWRDFAEKYMPPEVT